MKEKYFFDTIKKRGEGYLIDYRPFYTNNFASLTLTFIKYYEKEEMARIAEKELLNWVKEYPITTSVTLYDEFNNIINVKDFPSDGLLWWINPNTKQTYSTWETKDRPNYSIENFKEVWDKLFKDISFRTLSQIKKK